MIASVLCPGPSLAESQPPYEGMRIAVNAAIMHAVVDWWVALGPPGNFLESLSEPPWRYPCSLVTSLAFAPEWRTLYERWQAPPNIGIIEPQQYTVLAALDLAAIFGARTIRLYGCDQGGSDYAYGKPGNGSPTRWDTEKRLMDDWESRHRPLITVEHAP